MFFQKSRFSGYNGTSKYPRLVDRSSANFLRWTREGTLSCTRFSDFGYLYPFQRYSRSKWEGIWNRAKFSVFFAPKIFWGRPPNFWTGIYKLNMLPNMWQNFAQIGPQTSEISRWKK